MTEAVRVPSCAECGESLVALAGGGSYCMKCNLTPSLQDTAIMPICPQGHGELKIERGQWKCSECNLTYTF